MIGLTAGRMLVISRLLEGLGSRRSIWIVGDKVCTSIGTYEYLQIQDLKLRNIVA